MLWESIRDVMRLYTIVFLITLTSAVDITIERSGKYNISLAILVGVPNEFSNTSEAKLMCPKSCECYKQLNTSATYARCSDLTDEAYFEVHIEHFIYESWDSRTIESFSFIGHGVLFLKSIKIINNLFTWIEADAFCGLNYLTSVEIEKNGGLLIHSDAFKENTRLQSLLINQYTSFEIDRDGFENYLFDAPSVTNFTFRVSDYGYWSSSTFSKMTGLKRLSVSAENFDITPGIFAPLWNLVKLEILHVEDLNIVENSFSGTENLEELKFAFSRVSSLSNINTPKLRNFQMEWMKIADIQKDDFSGMPELEKLEITFCNIEKIHEDAFSNLTHLKHLDISNNNIMSLTENHLRNNFELEVLLMNFNMELGRLPVFRLNATDNRNHSIILFQCNNCGLESIDDGTFDTMPNLKYLLLNTNRLRSLPRDFFKPLSSLGLLDLSDNLISYLPEDMFQGATQLKILHLNANPLTTITMSTFSQAPNLLSLDLSMCRIKVWEKETPPLENLIFLSLEGNELKSITVEQMETVPNLMRLQLLYNPIKCDDIFNETIKWLEDHRVATRFDVPYRVQHCDGIFPDELCWNFVNEYICEQGYISELENLTPDEDHDGSIDITDQYNYNNYNSYDRITSAMILLNIVIVTTIITLLLIKFRSLERTSTEKIIIP